MKERRKAHSVGKTILTVVLVILLLAGAGYFTYAYFQVEKIKVEGDHPSFSDGDIAKLADIQPKTHMFFVDTDEIKEKIETEPYLEVDSITKEYPKTLVVHVTERQPMAVISASDQYLLADANANVMEMIAELPAEPYPVVNGFVIDAVNLGKQISTQDSFKLTVYTELMNALTEKEIKDLIETIDLTDINNIKMKTRDGLEIKFGQSDKITDKVKMIKRMIPKLAASGDAGGILDVTLGISATYQLNENSTATPQDGGTQDDPAQSGDGGTEPDGESSTDPGSGE
ncbi:cell division protein FtsQ/DivIB [Christensenella tenuis]|uniref:FtsQ-type POTRA domain-containing protein n=1 Tax=Christensenella tenuis TaxID=2763033 RepID=A0ABR7EC23_9FIRM|nr:FtsQ-type POTRA domain-containing protein [Christensenella tenuis]MBC5647322.1 FtsQ-type POTRA domain-containing protein [Christensenella tenuis]